QVSFMVDRRTRQMSIPDSTPLTTARPSFCERSFYRTPSWVRSGAAVLFLVLLTSIPLPTVAQQMQGCEDPAQIRQHLKIKFHEELAAIATNEYVWRVGLYASADGKNWTLVATRPNGPACVFGVGREWQMVAPIAGYPM